MFGYLRIVTVTLSRRPNLACVGHVWKSLLCFPSKCQTTYDQNFQVFYIPHFYLDLKKIKGIEIKIF
jgi:hypothetical protein